MTNHETEPVCKFEQGCHRVAPCDPGCGTPWRCAEEAGPEDVLVDAVALLREAATLYDAREQPKSAGQLRELARSLDAGSLPAVSVPPPAPRADDLRWAAEMVGALDRRELGIQADTIRDAWEEGRDEAADLLRRLADEVQQPDDGEGDELVCVDECGFCDACGFEPFGTPAEGWREAARFLRRTARDSGDRQGVLHGARLIEAELHRLADESGPCVAGEQQNETPEAPVCGRTKSVAGTEYPPCGREPGHEEAYCRSADGKQHFLAVGYEEPHP